MKRWERDKWKHFIVGIPLGTGLQVFSLLLFPAQTGVSLFVAAFLLLAICYGFELFSKFTGKGHYELRDVVAGVLGGMIGIGLYWLFYYLLFL